MWTTSAPKSAKVWLACDPAGLLEKSATRSPESGSCAASLFGSVIRVPPEPLTLSKDEYTQSGRSQRRSDVPVDAEGPAADVRAVLLTEVKERIGTITLNRPDRRNALNGELMAALDAATRDMAQDNDVKIVILTGAAPEGGHGGFCSGGDVKGGGRGSPGSEKGVPPDALSGDLARHDLHAAMLLHQMPKPSIAMVGGPAVGAGCSLAAACDFRFASTEAVFATNFSPNGLSGDYGGSFLWTRIVGTAKARQLYFLNEKILAERALEMGMVHAVLPPEKLHDYTYEVAHQLARTPAALLALVKENLNAAEDEVERRRWLFAHEAENQYASAKEMMERIQAKAAAAKAESD
jgi:2-(1,2-epoxy-1,2-dihydrophenyl)acetyl-CoA isomerase